MIKFPNCTLFIFFSAFILPFVLSGQCAPPAGFAVYPPITSSSIAVKWNTAAGASAYQIRYWEAQNPSEKTIVDQSGPSPFSIRGLKKNTAYQIQIRSVCNGNYSNWSSAISATTSNSSGSCGGPLNVTATVNGNNVLIQWTSTGIYGVKYRPVGSTEWFVPAGAMNTTGMSFPLNQLLPGSYEARVQKNCSSTSSAPATVFFQIAFPCTTPAPPAITPDVYQATVSLPPTPGVLGYVVSYRLTPNGAWMQSGQQNGNSYLITGPLLPSNTYEVMLMAVCTGGMSNFSPITTFTTLPEPITTCLKDKHAGKNLTAQQLEAVKAYYNRPSPYSFGEMIGINDGGLIFRSFQNQASNQILQLTRHFRNFHTMDEDFDASLNDYNSNIKPKNTVPEGTPANIGYNKGLYQLYHNTHGFTGITAATELLQYAPQSWKDKIYRESDWSAQGPAGIRLSFKNYTKTFIQQFAPANGNASQLLAANFQVGNELWDYPVKADYQSLLLGARDAFVSQYGPKSQGGWKMRLIAGAFQAYRDGNCTSTLRDVSNCNGDLQRHDFIGDYLDVAPDQCGLLQDLGAIDCHPYSFKSGTTNWTFPEDPDSETRQIASLAAWLKANRDEANGILTQTSLWSSEFGFDSYTVGEKTQAAYLLRGLFLHSRFHFEKVYFYNAFDATYPNGPGYDGLYGSSGLWRQGKQGVWPSPLVQNNASPKPAWYGLMDLKSRFGQHVFFGVLGENQDVVSILMAKPDSTEPVIVFWSPKATTDANADQNVPVSQAISWQQWLPADYRLEGDTALQFAHTENAGSFFDACTGVQCGTAQIKTVRRYPAFVRLVPCNGCFNVTNPGQIAAPAVSSGMSPFDPDVIQNQSPANGGDPASPIVYQWQSSLDQSMFTDIPGGTSATFNPPALNQTTYFRRGARRLHCPEWVYSSSIGITINPVSVCPLISRFERKAHFMSNCNPQGDFYFEIQVDQVNADVTVELDNLPGNGINIPMSLLNGDPFTPGSFQTHVQYIDAQTYRWHIKASNGSSQVLRLYYCWANNYPPAAQSSATNFCNNQIVYCSEAFNDPGAENRNQQERVTGNLGIWPNPGADQLHLSIGETARESTVRVGIWSSTGQLMQEVWLCPGQTYPLHTQNWPAGMYVVSVWLNGILERGIWVKQ